MKSNLVKKFIGTILLLLLISCSAGKSGGGINGGFEDEIDDNAGPVGWSASYVNTSGGLAGLYLDDSKSHSGSRSITIAISKDHPAGGRIYKWVKRVDRPANFKVYELNAWISTHRITGSPFIEAQCWSRDKMLGKISSIKKYSFTGTKDWQNLRLIFRIPDGTLRILLVAGLNSAGNEGGQVWFDDVEISALNKKSRN